MSERQLSAPTVKTAQTSKSSDRDTQSRKTGLEKTMNSPGSAEMSAAEVRFALEEIQTAYNHLEFSQKELLQFIGGDEAGTDVEVERQAFEENKHVLVKKRARAKDLFELLEKIDPAYFVENQQALRTIKANLDFDALTPDEIEASDLILRDLNNRAPIEIVRNGERQFAAEERMLHGREDETGTSNSTEPSGASGEGLYL